MTPRRAVVEWLEAELDDVKLHEQRLCKRNDMDPMEWHEKFAVLERREAEIRRLLRRARGGR